MRSAARRFPSTRILGIAGAELPADGSTCSARPTRAPRPSSCAALSIAHKYTDKPVYVRALRIRTRTYGAYEVHATFAPLDEDVSPTVYASKAAYEAAGIGPEDVLVKTARLVVRLVGA